MSGARPPHGIITENDRGPYVVLTVYILMVTMLLTVITRMIMRFLVIRMLKTDDFLLTAATILAVIQSILVVRAEDRGLGKHRLDLSDADFGTYSKYNYASQLLFIFVLFCSKVSLIILTTSITPSKGLSVASQVLMGVIAAWALASFFALAFQCHLPSPWDFTPGRCLNQQAMYDAIGATNILTEVAIIALPVLMMWTVQVTTYKRVEVMLLFGVRILVCAAIVVHLAILTDWFKSSDKTWANVNPTIAVQFVMHLSVITACIPSLKRFLSDLQTGHMNTKIPDSHLELSNRSKSYGLNSRSSNKENGQTTSSKLRAPRFGNKHDPNVGDGKANNVSTVFGTRGGGRERGDSVTALTDERNNGIMQTLEVRIDNEDRENGSGSGGGKSLKSF
ncbi:MAG: hypothetical protein M1812_006996 [Candelaria pacifica]|nr:MAG: hypothetical protein M1812_006996 [Candelaria pacifica]